MSDFIAPATMPVARKPHRCIACGGPIPTGERHVHQKANWDGAWGSNRFHDECWESLFSDGENEFTPGELDMPPRIAALVNQPNPNHEAKA